jgi:hypothetical protein
MNSSMTKVNNVFILKENWVWFWQEEVTWEYDGLAEMIWNVDVEGKNYFKLKEQVWKDLT